MKKIAFLFPGQGAQYVGMGKDFYEQSQLCKDVYKQAEEVTGIPVAELCFEENDRLNITEFTQIAILTTEIAMLRALEEKGIHASVTAGLSLGEYGAIVASGVLTQEDAFRLIRKRGIYMQEAVPTGGAMSAVLGMKTSAIEKICEQIEGVVGIANYNCPGQIVITGEEAAVAKASEKLKEAGAKRCIALKVSGPFHSPLLETAGVKLAEELEGIEIHDIEIPYISNVTADYVTDKKQIKSLLEKQVSSSVKWQQSIEKMIHDGVSVFIEIGPGKTLTGFMKKIDSSVQVMNIEKYEDLEKVVTLLTEAE